MSTEIQTCVKFGKLLASEASVGFLTCCSTNCLLVCFNSCSKINHKRSALIANTDILTIWSKVYSARFGVNSVSCLTAAVSLCQLCTDQKLAAPNKKKALFETGFAKRNILLCLGFPTEYRRKTSSRQMFRHSSVSHNIFSPFYSLLFNTILNSTLRNSRLMPRHTRKKETLICDSFVALCSSSVVSDNRCIENHLYFSYVVNKIKNTSVPFKLYMYFEKHITSYHSNQCSLILASKQFD